MRHGVWYTGRMTSKQQNQSKVHGLVLGGGGARGCYEVGAWQAFQDCGISFQCVSGTSIGAIVGALYTQQTIEPLIRFVHELQPSHIVADMPAIPENFEEIVANRDQLFAFLRGYMKEGTDISPLRDSLSRMFDYDRFMASPIDFACMTFNVTTMKGEAFYKKDMTKDDAVDIILASASCFPAFPMAKIHDDLYIDGGFENNLPIQLCQTMGADDFVVIDVHGPGRVRRIDDDSRLIKRIQPLLPIGNFLDFSQAQAVRSLRIGYLETMKYYNRFCGYLFTFDRNSWPKIYMCEKYLDLVLHGRIEVSFELTEKAYMRILGYKPAPLANRYAEAYRYGRLIECLAFEVGMDPVRLYDFNHFLRDLDERLASLPEPAALENPKALHEFLHNRKKEEVLHFFHMVLVQNKGRLPLVYEPLKTVFEIQYVLAQVWYALHMYLSKAR